MAIVKKLNDSIRVKILSAMTQKRSVTPNVRQIKKITGFHRATIKSSIDFLESENFVYGYRPLLNPLMVGYNLKSFSYLQTDLSQKKTYNKLKDLVLKDNHVFHCSEVISDTNANVAVGFLSKSIEDHHKHVRNNYSSAIPNYFDFIKKKSAYYLTTPYLVSRNEIDVLIDLLKKEQGIVD